MTARALARPFTYRVSDEVGRGDVVSMRLANRRVRGVVVAHRRRGASGSRDRGCRAGREHGPGSPRRARSVGRGLLRLDACPGAGARRAVHGTATRRAPRAGVRARARRRARAGRAHVRLSATPSAASSPLSTRAAGTSCCTARPGSGKTEVYLQACAAALERGRGVIVLVPEIALTPQTVGSLPRALPATRWQCSTRRSPRPSAATSASASRRARRGSSSVRARPSSRRFATLGLLVVDEEHDGSFKQESDPRYDARTVAAKRAALEGAIAVYGSATPRVESWSRLERLGASGPDRRSDAHGEARRPPARGGLPALGAAPRRARRRRGTRRARDPAPEPERDLGSRPLPGMRRRRAAATAATSR